MANPKPFKTIVIFISLITLVVILSMISSKLWGGKPKTLTEPIEWTISEEMTLKDFGQANGLPNPMLKKIFELQNKAELEKKLKEYGTPEQIKALVIKRLALAGEHETKNWMKILIKFFLWFFFLIAVFLYFRKKKVSSTIRNTALALSIFIFGVIMGSDPSPMGTVKDAIHLYGSAGAVFPPRMIALTIFLGIVFVANKYICAWGCQAGVLQDLIFRINQTPKMKAIIGRQIKVPFAFSNSVRILFLCMFTLVAFTWGTDIIEPFDPFKIYNPVHLSLTGIIFLGILLMLSLFVYRPWCHFFCPFGLVGWLVEKASRIRISVAYETCVACQKCATDCPSTVMSAILKQDKKTIPDCFSCYTCRDVCPTGSITFSTRKRAFPPPGHFDQKNNSKTNSTMHGNA